MDHLHQTHSDIIKRLRRAEGHLRRVIGMIEEGRSCVDLAQQLHAVEKAVGQAKKTLIHDHVDHCLADAVMEAESPIAPQSANSRLSRNTSSRRQGKRG